MADAPPTPHDFVQKWSDRNLTERASSQAHFIELCRLLGVPAPYDNRNDDANYCFDALTAAAGSHQYAPKRTSDRKAKAPRAPLFQPDPPEAPAVTDSAAIVSAPKEGHGFADVWKRGHFCWEYKRQGVHADLAAALRQLKEYKDSLYNPPLLIVCDIDQFEIHTNFTDHPPTTYAFRVQDLADPPAEWREGRGVSPLTVLKYAFTDPEWFRPKQKTTDVTEEFAAKIGELARQITDRKASDPHAVAHFLMQVVFALFAEDIGLLPKDLVTQVIQANANDAARFKTQMRTLFRVMEKGGDFGIHGVPEFNGGLFENLDAQPIPDLSPTEIGLLSVVAQQDWSAVEPSILGTLFERSLDPNKRAQIGAHYTSRDDIMLIVEPVILAPLRAEWEQVKADAERALASGDGVPSAAPSSREAAPANSPGREPRVADANERRAPKGRHTPRAATVNGASARAIVKAFADRLSKLRILDPACGSGNFLYVAIQSLLDLERQVIRWAAERNLTIAPKVNPTQLHGIEINDYAAELARISIWIGYLKWQREHGATDTGKRPILDKLDTIEHRDAILDRATGFARSGAMPVPEAGTTTSPRSRHAAKGAPATKPLATPARWPEADFIIGNPPFLGSKLFRKWGLSDDYLKALYAAYDLPKTSDLCCYWFELARRAIDRAPSASAAAKHPGQKRARSASEGNTSPRVGLLATQGIRGGDNRTVLERIKQTGDIFMAWSDREWILDGAAVHVSMIGFADGTDGSHTLDGHRVERINPDLTAGADTTGARPLEENHLGMWSIGTQKGGSFDIDQDTAIRMLAAPNPDGRSNSEVVRPWWNAADITGRWRGLWIIDFGPHLSTQEAALYEMPFRYVERVVYPERRHNRRDSYRDKWWIHQEPRAELRAIIEAPTQLLTPRVAKHRVWLRSVGRVLADCALVTFSRADDYLFGVLHSSVHELWARSGGTQLREAESGFRYTPTTCFETFPLPWPPGHEPVNPKDKHHALYRAIADAAAGLDRLRENWLNPPDWIAAIETQVDLKYRSELASVPEPVRPLVRRSAIMAEAAKDPKLKKRTLTNLYNERPAWLRDAHEKLDRAVLAAYAAIDPAPKSEPPRWDPDWAKAYKPFGAGEIETKITGKRRDTPESTAAKQAALNARKPIDERVLANLLRLNNERSPAGANG